MTSINKSISVPPMDPKQFALWQQLLEKQTGLWLPESRKIFLLSALARHIKQKGINSYLDLYNKLSEGELSLFDWASLVDSLTVHETCYYRDNASFELVNNYCRDRALKAYKNSPNDPQHFQVWSVGCSTGEEAYTLAIELDKIILDLKKTVSKSIYFGVVGVDISYPSLAVAREGIYAGKQLSFMPNAIRNYYFHRLADDYYQIKSNIRQRTCFIQCNVLELDNKMKQQFDVIYCQNVLIYFRNQKKQQVIEQFAKRLKPGGLLVLGHGEVTSIDNKDLIRVDSKDCLAYLRTA